MHVCSKEWFSHLCGNTIFSEPGPFVCYNHNIITGTSAQDTILFRGKIINVERHIGFAFPFICMYVPMLLRFSISPNVKRTMYLYVHIKYHT